MIRYLYAILFSLLIANTFAAKKPAEKLKLFTADNHYFQYTGRIDFTDPKKPKFWSPGVYITANFKGTECRLLINDEVIFGNTHNYIEIVVDGVPKRIRTTGKTNTITIATGLKNTAHKAVICKDTESGMGYLEFTGLMCNRLLPPPAQPVRRIEYIGDSITAGTGLDESQTPCGKGQWYDQHNAYLSYGARTSRALNAQWQITAVAGIGLMHSCCDMDILLPQVYDKVYLRNDSLKWDFNRYKADVVTICLGQNDGRQDSAEFCSRYIRLINTIRKQYAGADIVCLSSPMANAELTALLQRYLNTIVKQVNGAGDQKVSRFFFSKSFNSGCDRHPNRKEHALIAAELTSYLKKLKNW